MPPRDFVSSSRSFQDAYRANELRDFFLFAAGDVDGALTRPVGVDRTGLAAALRSDHERWGMSEPTRRSLERLAHPASRVVVTGQQVGWLLGPSYTLSKAVTAVRLAAQLDSEERPVVPVFWMATQDHDVSEMDHAWVLGRDERVRRIAAPIPNGPAVGRAPLDPRWIEDTIAALHDLDGRGPYAADVEALLLESCSEAPRWSDGFARLLLRLLGDQGLLIVDPLSRRVAERWRARIERELESPARSAALVNRAGERLSARGFAPQLTRAEGATNLFVERPGGGPRELLRIGDDGALDLGGARVGVETLRAYLDEDPTSLTPAAGLRPVLQDAILPTAVFVVGPGELKYVAQLRDVYDFHDVPMPLAWPRASATVLQPPVRRILERHQLDWRDVMRDPDAVEAALQLRRHGHGDAFAASLVTIEREVASLLEHVSEIDPTLVGTVHRGRYHLERTVLTLREKAGLALARQDADTRRQFERLRAHLRPNGGVQERVLSPFTYFLTLGVESVRDAFLTLPPRGEHALRF